MDLHSIKTSLGGVPCCKTVFIHNRRNLGSFQRSRPGGLGWWMWAMDMFLGVFLGALSISRACSLPSTQIHNSTSKCCIIDRVAFFTQAANLSYIHWIHSPVFSPTAHTVGRVQSPWCSLKSPSFQSQGWHLVQWVVHCWVEILCMVIDECACD